MDKKQRGVAVLLALFTLSLAAPLFAASSLSCLRYDLGGPSHGKKIVCTWVAHTDGSFTATETLALGGFVAKVVTNPGSPAPTDDYDIACGDPSDATVDVFDGDLANRDTLTTEQVYPVATNATMPVYATTCTPQITNNSQNGGTGTIEFYVLRP
jgi:hypothetical protein